MQEGGNNIEERSTDRDEEDTDDEDYENFTKDDENCNDDELFDRYTEGTIEEVEIGGTTNDKVHHEAKTTRCRGRRVRRRQPRHVSDDTQLEGEGFDHVQEDRIGSRLEDREQDNVEYVNRYRYFDGSRDMMNPSFQIGLRFASGEEFKEAMSNLCIRDGKNFRFRPREQKKKVRFIYRTKECKWFIFVGIEKTIESKDLVVKSMNLSHSNCNHE